MFQLSVLSVYLMLRMHFTESQNHFSLSKKYFKPAVRCLTESESHLMPSLNVFRLLKDKKCSYEACQLAFGKL